jgi:hypothetical protein
MVKKRDENATGAKYTAANLVRMVTASPGISNPGQT